jgi:hypothetical protein
LDMKEVPTQVDLPASSGRSRKTLRYGAIAFSAAAALTLMSPHAAADTSPDWDSSRYTVSSTGPDTRTGITVRQGQQFSIFYDGGSWNTNQNDANSPWIGPEGNPLNAQGDVRCRRIPGIRTGAMVLEINGPGREDPTTPVGNGGTFTADTTGQVELYINERGDKNRDCTYDNGGTISVVVQV